MAIRSLLTAVATFVLLLACANTSEDPSANTASDVAPAQLVVQGQYSDRRFIDMMAPHHGMAVEMATMALTRAAHPELREMAQNVIASQSAEIAELKAVKKREYGTDQVPSRMNPDEIAESGIPSMDELAQAPSFDCAFIDGMLPHHSDAIRMASVARRQSGVIDLRTMSRAIIDAQSKEIGQMAAWRKTWCSAEHP